MTFQAIFSAASRLVASRRSSLFRSLDRAFTHGNMNYAVRDGETTEGFRDAGKTASEDRTDRSQESRIRKLRSRALRRSAMNTRPRDSVEISHDYTRIHPRRRFEGCPPLRFAIHTYFETFEPSVPLIVQIVVGVAVINKGFQRRVQVRRNLRCSSTRAMNKSRNCSTSQKWNCFDDYVSYDVR